MRLLPEIEFTINAALLIAYGNSYLLLADIGDFSFAYTTANGFAAGPPTGLAVINEDGVAYEFREMDLPTSGFMPTTLDELLAVMLGGADSVMPPQCVLSACRVNSRATTPETRERLPPQLRL
jgi:hypothetical protein